MNKIPDPKPTRLLPLDTLRGLIMALMALDHANYFIAQKHSSGEHWGGSFPAYREALPFLTRFVTHLSAPGFFFLMGVGMVLFAHSRGKKGWSNWAIIRHLFIRGLILIGLQFSLVNFAWRLGNPPFPEVYIGVLVALGGTMIIGSILLNMKPLNLLVISGVLFVGMELTHPDPGQWGQIFDQPLGLILGYSGGDFSFWSNYPILPWLELVVFGMAFGNWLLKHPRNPRKIYDRAWKIGTWFILTFTTIRFLNGFGNIRPMAGDIWIDFFNVVKYPPSMTFTLLTTGVNLLLLWVFSRVNDRIQRYIKSLTVFGRVPLFFYLTHLYLYAALGNWLTPYGTSVLKMFYYWLGGLAVLYLPCLWYGEFKHRQPARSIWRFF